MLVLLTSILIFVNIGHKASALIPVLVFIGLLNRFFSYKIRSFFVLGFVMFMLIGALNYIRSSPETDFYDSSYVDKSLSVFYIYEYNYIPIVSRVHDGRLDYQYGEEYLTSLMSFVPRFIWPEKSLSFDYFLKEEFGRTFEGGGLPPTIVGSLYINFGLAGVLSGMFLIGWLYSAAYAYYKKCHVTQAPFVLYFMFIVLNPSQFFGTMVFVVIFGGIVYVFSKRKIVFRELN